MTSVRDHPAPVRERAGDDSLGRAASESAGANIISRARVVPLRVLAADVARDAADVVLVTEDLGILAAGVVEARRIFSNTVKYVLMAVSSNFGNMLSSAGAALFLPFLPLLPSQVLLNNLLYDVSEMTIPTDRVDAQQVRRSAFVPILAGLAAVCAS